METRLYNGVELPVLPSGYEESHPNRYIWLDTTGNYGLLLSNAVFTASDAGVTTEGTYRQYVFVPNDYDAWAFQFSLTGKTITPAQSIWSNHDILNEDGSIYLAASDPIPVTIPKWAHMNSFLAGLALGLAGKPLALAREPVAYLYNGVRLPKLPEWDKEKYPYAYIANYKYYAESPTDVYGEYELVCSNVELTADAAAVKSGAVGTFLSFVCSPSIGETAWAEIAPTTARAFTHGTMNHIWANHDILKGEEVYLAATEPVPVYE